MGHCYAMLWPVLNRISIPRSLVEIPFCALHFVGVTLWTQLFCSRTHRGITIGNGFDRDVHCDNIMGHDIVNGAYYQIIMQNDGARTPICYILLYPL